jgi:hypothetical protein
MHACIDAACCAARAWSCHPFVSLGVILYILLSGVPPYDSQISEVCWRERAWPSAFTPARSRATIPLPSSQLATLFFSRESAGGACLGTNARVWLPREFVRALCVVRACVCVRVCVACAPLRAGAYTCVSARLPCQVELARRSIRFPMPHFAGVSQGAKDVILAVRRGCMSHTA